MTDWPSFLLVYILKWRRSLISLSWMGQHLELDESSVTPALGWDWCHYGVRHSLFFPRGIFHALVMSALERVGLNTSFFKLLTAVDIMASKFSNTEALQSTNIDNQIPGYPWRPCIVSFPLCLYWLIILGGLPIDIFLDDERREISLKSACQTCLSQKQ